MEILFLKKKIKEYKHIKKESKSILFISDGHTTKKVLQELALYLNSELHDYKIFYKLRPEEYHTLNEEYSLFQQASNHIHVIQDDYKDIFYYFKRCEFVIGTNSTALVEAIPFSEVLVYKRVGILNLKIILKKNL